MCTKIKERCAGLEYTEKCINAIFDSLFEGPPPVDCSDPLDGDSISYIAGRRYMEVVPMIGDELDCIPLFDLIDDVAARYYLGSYLIDTVRQVGLAWKRYPITHNPWIIGVGFFSMIRFLSEDSTIIWIISNPGLLRVVVTTLDYVVNSTAFFIDGEKLEEIGRLRRMLVPEQYDSE